tara:strand:+ start:11076 stop:11576 length:501 start_codon:yes stop_codon:yes gene_type:complete
MKISLSIDISADELGSILAGALMGAKEAMASKKQKTGAVKYKFRKVSSKKQEQKPVAVPQEPITKKRGPGRPRLTPEQKEERLAKKQVEKSGSKKRVMRRWSTQEVAWLKKKIGKKKKVTRFSDSTVAKFEKTFGYARTEKSLVMKAQDLLGNRRKYKGRKYGKNK